MNVTELEYDGDIVYGKWLLLGIICTSVFHPDTSLHEVYFIPNLSHMAVERGRSPDAWCCDAEDFPTWPVRVRPGNMQWRAVKSVDKKLRSMSSYRRHRRLRTKHREYPYAPGRSAPLASRWRSTGNLRLRWHGCRIKLLPWRPILKAQITSTIRTRVVSLIS